jgi:hypothetical protein
MLDIKECIEMAKTNVRTTVTVGIRKRKKTRWEVMQGTSGMAMAAWVWSVLAHDWL